MSQLSEKIRSRGHWRVMIRPARFVEKRIPEIRALFPLLEKSSVHLRGWDFPHIDSRNQPHFDIDWIGQESEWEHHLETWRFYQSGLFVDLAGMHYDWRDQSEWFPAPKGWEPNTVLGVVDAVYRLTEIFEFAARVSLTEAGDEKIHIEIVAGGLGGRRLWVDDPGRGPLFADYKASLTEFPYKTEVQRTELAANPRELAIKAAQELFWRFGWDAPVEVLRDIQAGLRK